MQQTLRRTARRARRGFTMIELIAVVAVIAILVGVAQMNFGATKEEAYQRAMESDAKNFITAQEQHFNTWDQYMTTVQTLGTAATSTHGNFRLSDDVLINIVNNGQLGYTANFLHRKFRRGRCQVVHNTTVGSRVNCTVNANDNGYNETGYAFQAN